MRLMPPGGGVVLKREQGPPSSSLTGPSTTRGGAGKPGEGVASPAPPFLAVTAIFLLDLAVVIAWTTWWHLSDFSGDGSLRSLLDRATRFLSWTFAPCWIIAIAVLLISWPLIRRRQPRKPAVVRAALTLIAPAVWAIGFCGYYDQFDYLPMAMLVAVAAWIVTLQPLWAYLVLYRLGAERRR